MKLLSTLLLTTSFLSLFSNHIPQKDTRSERERFIMEFIKPGDIGCEIGEALILASITTIKI